MTPPPPSLTDHEISHLFNQLAGGDPQAKAAISALYRHFRKPVLVHLGRNGLDPGSAEDVLQTVFIKLLKRAGQWRGDGSAAAWFWSIVRNAAVDHHRAHKSEVQLDEDAWAHLVEHLPAPDTGPDTSTELQRCVQQALQRFAKAHPERAQAIRLMHQEDWSIAQIAQLLERTPAATKEFLSQCRKAFRKFVEPCVVWLQP